MKKKIPTIIGGNFFETNDTFFFILLLRMQTQDDVHLQGENEMRLFNNI
jgi:hypothetical protein